MDDSLMKYGFGSFISFYVIKEGIGLFKKFILKTADDTKTLKLELEKKVNKEDCDPAMRRVGKNLDCHDERIEKIRKSITKTEKALIYLVGKAGGDAASMGLYE